MSTQELLQKRQIRDSTTGNQLGLVGFQEDIEGPPELPTYASLRVATQLGGVLETCANHIYANDGCLKERAFQEMTKVLFAKLWDEKHETGSRVRFGITAGEFLLEKNGVHSDFFQRLSTLFQEAAAAHPTLFNEHEPIRIQRTSLAVVANALQPFSLSRTNPDVVGVAFQRLVAAAQRGDRGEYFTPEPVIRLAIDLAQPQPDEKVLDPACGSGGFLLAVLHRVRKTHPGVDLSEFAHSGIRGIDFNPDIARIARLQLAFQFDAEGSIIAANSLDSFERIADSANQQRSSLIEPESFDLIVTNPPFGTKGKVVDKTILARFDLAHTWRENKGSWSIDGEGVRDQSPDVLFLEQCYRYLKPGGRLAVVLPDGILHNSSAGYVRSWLLDRMQLQASVSLPQETFIPFGTGVKTSLLLLRRLPVERPSRSGQSGTVFFAAPASVGYDVKGRPIYRTDRVGKVKKDTSGQPVLDEDLSEIGTHFERPDLLTSDSHFRVDAREVRELGRIDTQFFVPSVREMENTLKAGGAKKLGELATILRSRSSFRETPGQRIRYVALSDIDVSAAEVAIPQEILAFEAPSRATYRVREGDILLAVSGAAVGTVNNAVALVTAEFDGCICSNGFTVLREIRGVEPLFLLHYLRSQPFLRQAFRRRTGHAIPSLSNSDLEQILVPIPLVEIQAGVAAVAREIFCLRAATQEKSRHLTDQIGQALSVRHS